MKSKHKNTRAPLTEHTHAHKSTYYIHFKVQREENEKKENRIRWYMAKRANLMYL